MKLLICAGGTGGGVYPALSVREQLSAEILWVGGVGGMEADLVKRENIPFEAIPAAGVAGVGFRALPGNLLKLGQGLLASRKILRRFQPDVLLFTGGYVAVPMALAARIPRLGVRRPQILLYVPDIEPGLALKTLARFADSVAVTADASRAYFAGRPAVAVTGYPLRSTLVAWEPEKARQVLGLSADLPTLLVWGGSKGARTINRSLLGSLPELLREMQIVHISGQAEWPEVEAARTGLASELAVRYHVYPYLHEEIGAAYTAADLVLSRAGASTLGELPFFGLPAVLVPYPYAWRYQRVNADYLVQHSAAVVVENADLPSQILPVVRGLMRDANRRAQMRQSMRGLSRPQAAEAIAGLVRRLAMDGTHG